MKIMLGSMMLSMAMISSPASSADASDLNSLAKVMQCNNPSYGRVQELQDAFNLTSTPLSGRAEVLLLREITQKQCIVELTQEHTGDVTAIMIIAPKHNWIFEQGAPLQTATDMINEGTIGQFVMPIKIGEKAISHH